MRNFPSILARFPKREADIRERCEFDYHFRSICSDYETAARATHHWQNAEEHGGKTIQELKEFMDELELEILGLLEVSGGIKDREK